MPSWVTSSCERAWTPPLLPRRPSKIGEITQPRRIIDASHSSWPTNPFSVPYSSSLYRPSLSSYVGSAASARPKPTPGPDAPGAGGGLEYRSTAETGPSIDAS